MITKVKANKPSDFSQFKLLVGLGNPGREYAGAYHNAGKLFVEHLKNSAGEGRWKVAGDFAYLKKEQLVVVKSLVFMNESGRAVAQAAHFFKVKPTLLAVAHDDSDLKLGEWKISFGQGSAGHNGVESAIRELGTKDFWRLRFGIRPPREMKRKKAGEFVLKKISASDKAVLSSVFGDVQNKLGF